MTIQETLVMVVMAGLVFVTIVLVLLVETGLTSADDTPITSAHAVVRQVFRRRFLNGSREEPQR